MAASMAYPYGNKITLKSSDGKEFEVDGRVAMNSDTILRMIEHNYPHAPISLPNVNSNVLPKVIEYCYMHADRTMDVQLKSWDAEFVKAVGKDTLFDLFLAANYLQIKGLVALACEAILAPCMVSTPPVVAAPPSRSQTVAASLPSHCGPCRYIIIFCLFGICGLYFGFLMVYWPK